MDDDLTHRITIIIEGKYSDNFKPHAMIETYGDGGLDHTMNTFKAFLASEGFSINELKQIDKIQSGE